MRAIRICCLLTAALTGCSGGRSDSAADPTPLMAHARAVATDVFAGNASEPGIAGSDGVTLPAPEALPKVGTVVPVIAVRQRLIPWERNAIATALEIAGMSPGEIPASAMVLPPEEFAAVNSQLTLLAGGGDTVALDSARHAYALAFPLAAHPIQWEGGTFFPAMVFAVPRANDPDDEDARIDLLRFLLALFVVFPAQQGPAPAAPNCVPPIPNTAQAVQDAQSRLSAANQHKNHPNATSKQGQWTSDRQNNRLAHGQTLVFYKAQLAVGCDSPTSWGVGLESFDLQFRIVLGPGAANRPAADGGATPGGLQGTLAHEAEHGETLAEAFRAALGGQNWNGIPWGIKTVLDDMRTTRYRTRAAAEAALPGYRKRLNKAVERLIRSATNLHMAATDGPNAGTAPRSGTAEPLDDPDQQKVADMKPKQAWIDELTDLMNNGYTSIVSPGQFGTYP